jgi:polar amino acid transport system substrate-binding protein
MLVRHLLIALVLSYPLLSPLSLKAQETRPQAIASPSPPQLRVGFAGDAPVVIVSEAGQIQGIAVEIWQDVANKLQLNYEIVSYPSVPDALFHLGLGDVDVVLGTVTVTQERLEQFDFTQPIAQDELTLLVHASGHNLWNTIRPFFGWAFISSVGVIYLCLVVVGNLIWLAEFRRNPEQFPPQYTKGVREGIWCALATFTTVGYGDRYPITLLGRTIAGGWAIISVAIVSSLTAGIATTLTLAISQSTTEQFRRPEDLGNARIAVIADSTAEQWAQYYHARIYPVKNFTSAIALLDQKQVAGVMYSRFFLENHLNQNPQLPYQIAGFGIGIENFSIALTPNSPLTQPLNKAIFDVDTQLRFKRISESWFNINDDSDNTDEIPGQ